MPFFIRIDKLLTATRNDHYVDLVPHSYTIFLTYSFRQHINTGFNMLGSVYNELHPLNRPIESNKLIVSVSILFLYNLRSFA